MSKCSVFHLRTCVLAAVLLVLAIGASSADEPYDDPFGAEHFFRVVDGELVNFDPFVIPREPHTHHFVQTKSENFIEIEASGLPGSEGYLETIAEIAEAVGGMDQLAFREGEVLFLHVNFGWLEFDNGNGEGISRMYDGKGPELEMLVRHGGDLSPMGGYFHRVVDGALIVPEPLIPYTGFFVQISTGHWVEVDPNLPLYLIEQFRAIEALVASGAPIIGPDGENQNGPVAVEAATWGAVKALFLR